MGRRRRPRVHLRVHSGGAVHWTLWCQEKIQVTASRNLDTTEVPREVTCRRCIALGGCGPNWPT